MSFDCCSGPWDRRNDVLKEEKYTLYDVEAMMTVLEGFFKDQHGNKLQEQLKFAADSYLHAVEQPGVSPLRALQDAVAASTFAQEIDALYAIDGGLIYYITNNKLIQDFDALRSPMPSGALVRPQLRRLSCALRADILQEKSLRKMQAIKKLMMANHLEEHVGGLTTEAVQPTDAVGQGLEAEVDQFGGGQEAKNDGIVEAMAEVSLGEAVVNSKDSNTQESG